MSKNTSSYWNVLSPENSGKWKPIEGAEGMLEQLTLAMDGVTGDYTRLTRFKAGRIQKNLVPSRMITLKRSI